MKILLTHYYEEQNNNVATIDSVIKMYDVETVILIQDWGDVLGH